MYFLMTNDVESFSISMNREDGDVAKQIYEVGLPKTLTSKTLMPRWLSRHSARLVIEKSLVRIQPGAFKGDKNGY